MHSKCQGKAAAIDEEGIHKKEGTVVEVSNYKEIPDGPLPSV